MVPKAPRTIGRYDVERMLGQGGMGRVWLARDTVLGRRVAIKVLRDDLALPPTVRDELVTRMRHEAQAAAAVSHPNIVALHDMGEDEAVGLFLVFEYVPGPRADGPESLRDRLREGPLPLAEVAKLARELGSALTFAHTAGVIHRDIKPENILFSRTGWKIADFGIARIPESTITRANTVLGTPAYTSPEALSTGDFGAASDQFAFAATLYEAATGVRAFGGPDAIATARNVSSEPPPPLEPALGSAPVVRALGAALSKGVAKEVAGRFASCVDLGEAVARAIERPDIEAPDDNVTLSERIEIDLERTPLSSRVTVERAKRTSDRPSPILTPYGAPHAETPARPSIIVRKQTHRWQNLVAASALIVIVLLVVFGRRTPTRERETEAQPVKGSSTVKVTPPNAAPGSGAPSRRSSPRLVAPPVAPSADAGVAPVVTPSSSPQDDVSVP